jgi:hypothetical protein
MRRIRKQLVYLDPDYKNFEPGRSQLKKQIFSPAYATTPILAGVGALFFGLLTVFSIVISERFALSSALTLGATGMWVWLLWIYERAQKKRRKLQLHGRLLTGRILYVQPAIPWTYGQQGRFARVFYQFINPAGQRRRAVMSVYNLSNSATVQLYRGDKVTVFYADDQTHVVM